MSFWEEQWHRLVHWFGWNGGTVVTWRSRSGRLMVGFRCDRCGELAGIHPAYEHDYESK